MFFGIVFCIIFWTHFWPKIGQNWPQNLVHGTPLFLPFSRLRFFVVFLLISGSLLAPFWLKVGCRVFVMFFWSVFGRFLKCFWLVFGVDFTCFSHTCSNCVFAYFFLGWFSTLCTLSKHGIFKKPCVSKVKTLFWRNRPCRQPMRKCISWDGIVPCFLLKFRDFWSFFWHRFSHRFLDAFFDRK